MPDNIEIAPLPVGFIRKGFCCGQRTIDNFFANNAGKQHENGQVRIHVATNENSVGALGFISLCLKTYEPELSEDSKKIYARVNAVPTVYLAMIGVNKDSQGKGIGKGLLWYACQKAVEIGDIAGTYALTLNAADEGLCEYYGSFGFIRMSEEDETLTMYLPLSDIRDAIRSEEADAEASKDIVSISATQVAADAEC